MTDKPIVFSAPMVRALLDGRKTQTRRVLKPYYKGCWVEGGEVWAMTPDGPDTLPLPYAPGDRLWVREAIRFDAEWDDCKPTDFDRADAIHYEADGFQEKRAWGDPFTLGRLRPSIHMPRLASRITLTVTDVRVQRLQEISRGDAMEEGCPFANMAKGPNPRDWYRDLWNSLHGPKAWDANPWVVALTFTVDRRNIDSQETKP